MEIQQQDLQKLKTRLLHREDDCVVDSITQLTELSNTANEVGWSEVHQLTDCCAKLLEIVNTSSSEDSDVHEIFDFICQCVDPIENALNSDDAANEALVGLATEARDRWGDCLNLLQEEKESDLDSGFECPDEDDSTEQTASVDLELILQSLTTSTDAPKENDPEDASPAESREESANVRTPNIDSTWSASTDTSSATSCDLDAETKEAFFDDARRCLSTIEDEVISYENHPENVESLKQICRELHTLKGASASINLSDLANYLHNVEDTLTDCSNSGKRADVDLILNSVDAVRRQLAEWSTPQEKESGSSRGADDLEYEGSHDSVRVKAGQIDRLLDMLAELVMLRNRRDSRVDKLKQINSEILKCVSRLRIYEERQATASYREVLPSNGDSLDGDGSVSSLTEIANDLLELGRCMREVFDPFAEENVVLSRFIRQFRGEMMELRRVPIEGLFKRLQRTVRDASKTEQKQVEFKLSGEHHGLERALHEKLYEPLMHIVRNAVSHGIELPSQRVAAGKDPMGQLSIDARAGANLFVIEVRDNGRGLDYDALRRRGIERGLLSADRPASRDELANLIFSPGFSTKNEVNEISGRGVGMDVVASTIESMHGWIEMESIPGEGTCLRVFVPRCSFIEHAMVFKTGGQFFAIPTQFIKSSRRLGEATEGVSHARFSDLLGIESHCSTNDSDAIVIQSATRAQSDANFELEIVVDSVVGPEEVVIRPLPSLLKAQRLFSGVTLSGGGTIMLLVDGEQLIELSNQSTDRSDMSSKQAKKRILVVDDSVTARRAVVERLQRIQSYEIEQASDGTEAVRLLKSRTFDAIFTDLDMPEMNGFELLTEARQVLQLGIPITVISSRADEQSRTFADQMGASAYLVKPASENELKKTLHRFQLHS